MPLFLLAVFLLLRCQEFVVFNPKLLLVIKLPEKWELFEIE